MGSWVRRLRFIILQPGEPWAVPHGKGRLLLTEDGYQNSCYCLCVQRQHHVKALDTRITQASISSTVRNQANIEPNLGGILQRFYTGPLKYRSDVSDSAELLHCTTGIRNITLQAKLFLYILESSEARATIRADDKKHDHLQ